MATKRQAQYKKKVRSFTDKVKEALEWQVYPTVFDSFRRVTDKQKFQRNDSIAGYARIKGTPAGIQEKYVRADTYNKYGTLFFELTHTDANGNLVYGVGMKSKAQIIVYAIHDEETDELQEVYFLSINWLKDKGKELIQEWGETNLLPIEMKRYQSNNQLRTGDYYTVYSYQFRVADLPTEAFVRVGKKKINWKKGEQV